MTPLTIAKIGLAIAGVAVWAYGVRANDATLRWIGIALLGAAVALRLASRWRR